MAKKAAPKAKGKPSAKGKSKAKGKPKKAAPKPTGAAGVDQMLQMLGAGGAPPMAPPMQGGPMMPPPGMPPPMGMM